MKLYKIATAPAGERWHSSKTGLKDPAEVEMPKEGRAGMAAFLNQAEAEIQNEAQGRVNWSRPLGGDPTVVETDPLRQAEQRAVDEAKATTVLRAQAYTATDIEDFILNRATVDQTANILSCLGTRFKELVNGKG